MKLIKKLMHGVWAYSQHSAANQAEQRLNMFMDRDLKDVGIPRGTIHQRVHSDCPWCKGT